MDAVSICNMALGQLGAKRIPSLDSDMAEAKQCKQYYDVCRQDLLREIEWKFAKRIAPLTLTVEKVQGWKFAYSMPSDCLFIRYIYSENGRELFKNQLEYFEVVSISESTTVIATNIEKAFIEYTYDLKNASFFPSDFRKALVYYLASELAIPLAASSTSKQECFSYYQAHLGSAAKANGNENRDMAGFRSEILMSRNGDQYD